MVGACCSPRRQNWWHWFQKATWKNLLRAACGDDYGRRVCGSAIPQCGRLGTHAGTPDRSSEPVRQGHTGRAIEKKVSSDPRSNRNGPTWHGGNVSTPADFSQVAHRSAKPGRHHQRAYNPSSRRRLLRCRVDTILPGKRWFERIGAVGFTLGAVTVTGTPASSSWRIWLARLRLDMTKRIMAGVGAQ